MDKRRRNLILGAIFGAVAAGALLPSACALRELRKKRTPRVARPPRRPPGEAKPMLQEDIAPVLARLDRWYGAHLADDSHLLNAPAPAAKIAAFERLVGIRMPQAYHQLYRWHDGETDDRRGHIYGLPILPLQTAAAEWITWKRAIADFRGNRYALPGAAWPEGAVDPAYLNPRWIPLTHDGSGNHIGLDFDPFPGGRVGQVILFGRDEDVKVVLAESLGRFLSWIADLLEGGNFRLEVGKGEQVLRRFRLRTPAVDGFHEGARILLGAPGQFL